MAETQPLELSEERTFTYRLCAGLVQVLSKVLFRPSVVGPKTYRSRDRSSSRRFTAPTLTSR